MDPDKRQADEGEVPAVDPGKGSPSGGLGGHDEDGPDSVVDHDLEHSLREGTEPRPEPRA